jgi:hypothetical protein
MAINNNNLREFHVLSLEPDYIMMKPISHSTVCLSDLHNVGKNNVNLQKCSKHNQVKGLSNPKQEIHNGPIYDQIVERCAEESRSIRGFNKVSYPANKNTFHCNDIRQKDNQSGFTFRLRSSVAISMMLIFIITG